MFEPIKNPSPVQVRDIIAASRHQAARRITDHRNGDVWCWPAEQATHREGADALDIPYDLPPGAGDMLFDA